MYTYGRYQFYLTCTVKYLPTASPFVPFSPSEPLSLNLPVAPSNPLCPLPTNVYNMPYLNVLTRLSWASRYNSRSFISVYYFFYEFFCWYFVHVFILWYFTQFNSWKLIIYSGFNITVDIWMACVIVIYLYRDNTTELSV